MNICVYCASSENIDKSYLNAGEAFGEALAENGHTLIFGAGKYGIMGAVARGSHRKNGNIIGIVPRFFDRYEVIFTECKLIKTDTMRERKKTMENKSDAFIMMPGGIGTLDEFFEMLTLKQLDRHRKPIVIYNVNGYFDSLLATLDKAIIEGFMSERYTKLFFVSDNKDEIFKYLDSYEPFSYDKYDND